MPPIHVVPRDSRVGGLHWLWWTTMVAAAYCGAASFGYWLGSVSTQRQAFSVWPAIGIGVVAVALGGSRMAGGIVIGGLAAELLRGVAFDESVANGLVSTVNPLLIAAILRFGGFHPSLGRLRNVVVLLGTCALATPIGATLGTATILAFRDESATVGLTWLTWWTGDFAGTLLVVPLLFEMVNRLDAGSERSVTSWRHAVAPVAVSLVLALAVFVQTEPLAFLVMPVLLWVGLRGDPLLGAIVNALVAGVAIVATVAGHGPFAESQLTVSLIVLAAFSAAVATSSLVLCAIAAERKRALEEVEVAAVELDQRVRDRTAELRLAHEAAEGASRAKSGFLAAMSHEIRTPMVGVTGMLEVLAGTELTPHQRQIIATAESSAQSLLQIIGDVLDFAKIEADKLELALTTVDVRVVVRAAAETFVHAASAKGLLLDWSADDALADADIADPLRLRQILCNFSSNAIKFTDVGGISVVARVVSASATDQTVELSVTDTGHGLSDEQQGRLFAEFAQADSATAQRFGGTGLGLVICRRLAVLMGGEVTLESRVGHGTTIRLIVPLPVADPADIASTPTPAASGLRPRPSRADAEREGSLLLLVDDHPVNRTVLRHQLNSVGFEVDVAGDGAEAFELYVNGRYGIVLTDVTMPVMNGYELAGAIRAHERATGRPRTPIIALSANVMQGEPERCGAAGMDDFAGKPTTIPFIAEKLRRWLPELVWQPQASAAASAEPDSMQVDLDRLAQLTGGDTELVAALLGDFIDSTRIDLAALDESVVARDPDRVRRHAHRMKGASRIVGADRLAEIAQQLEHRVAHGVDDWDRLGALVTDANRQLRAFERSIAANDRARAESPSR